MSIVLVAGLGNPGTDYATTRHNAGFAVVDALAARHALSWKRSSRFESKIGRWDRVDGRTCVLPVKREPGKTYVVWLNSPKFHNFKDSKGQSSLPYLLVFQTSKQ